MKTKEAIMAFSQSEKIKAGIIWISHAVQSIETLPVQERQGGEKVIRNLIQMLVNEVQLARTVAGEESWGDIERNFERAIIMINSGVASESITHLTQALSQITSTANRAMNHLKEENIF
jgi:hypothetical protein